MIWLFVALAVLIPLAVAGRSKPKPPSRRRDNGGSGVVMLDGAPIIAPNDNGFGLGDGFVHHDIDDDDTRFDPGGGSGGGGGASGSWDDGGSDGGDGGD